MGKKHKAIAGEIITASGPWSEMLVVCRKCEKKLEGGFGPKSEDSLAQAFKQVLRDLGRRRDMRILETGCLGVCPKGAVAVMHGARPNEILIVPEGLGLMQLAQRLARPAGPSATALASPSGD